MNNGAVDPSVTGESDLVQIRVDQLLRAPENDLVYRPVDRGDPEIGALAQSIAMHGVRESLVITRDRFILSGHRRYTAALLVGVKELPCRIAPFSRIEEPERFLTLLREYNRQRVKSIDEQVREAAINMNPADAHAVLIEERKARSRVKVAPLVLPGFSKRAAISDAREPFLDAVIEVLENLREFWPVSERQVHYNLLNDPPLIHASKRGSVYRNDVRSARALSDLIVRAMLEGAISEDAIGDDTRPVIEWDVYPNVGLFIDQQIEKFLTGYWRDPMQSQPNHIELVVEKNTIENVLRDVAAEFGIPMTSGRGFSSLPPRIKIKNRYRKSGKEKLILILVSDFDPSGEHISKSFARTLRDDFHLPVHPVKAALTHQQTTTLPDLPESIETKKKSTHYIAWRAEYGPQQRSFELEAVAPEVLQRIVRESIESVIDRQRFNEERERANQEAPELIAVRNTVRNALRGIRR